MIIDLRDAKERLKVYVETEDDVESFNITRVVADLVVITLAMNKTDEDLIKVIRDVFRDSKIIDLDSLH